MTLSMKTSCKYCPPGQRVVSHCNATHETVCTSCSPGTYIDQFSLFEECLRCANCRRRETVRHKCTSTRNTVCQCPPGYRYNPYKPCMKCPEGFTPVNDKCVPKKPPDRSIHKTPNKEVPEQKEGYPIPIALGASCFVIFIIIVILFVLFYKRRRAARRPLNNHPDLIPPDVPQKKGDYRSTPLNDYAPNPHICLVKGPIVPTPLLRETLPGSVIDGLRKLLDHDETIKLARVIGCNDRCFLSKLRRHDDPVEFLINNYLTTCPTKESFCEALIDIGQNEAAQLVWTRIPSQKFDSRIIIT